MSKNILAAHPWLVATSGTRGTTARNTGLRLAGFQAVTADGNTAVITGVGGTAPQTAVESIRTIIKAFADARNAHDGQTIADLYSEDGEWMAANGRTVRRRPALAAFWSSLPGEVQRTIESIDGAGSNIAVVRVVTQYPDRAESHHESFFLVKMVRRGVFGSINRWIRSAWLVIRLVRLLVCDTRNHDGSHYRRDWAYGFVSGAAAFG
jgi:hypothetical protein